MTRTRANRLIDLLAAVVACGFVASAAFLLMTAPAAPSTGTAGPASVSVTPTGGLVDGQTIAIHAQVGAEAELFEIKAHLCQGGVEINDTYNFGFDGPYCSKSPVSPHADAETYVEIPAGVRTGDLNFRVGEGTSPRWADFDGGLHTLTCGAGASCQLVVQLQVSNNTVFYAAPLCFGGSCPAEPGATPPPAAATTPSDGQGPPPASAQSTGAAPSQPGAAASAAPSSPGGGSAPAQAPATDGSSSGGTHPAKSGSAAAGAGSASGAAHTAKGSLTSETSPSSTPLSRGARVMLGGLAGLLGGVLIVVIVIRAHRRMSAMAAA
jgi:hypothetical protein